MKKTSTQLVLFPELNVPLVLPVEKADIYARVAFVTNEETSQKFAKLVAGLAVYIPATASADHWLANEIGHKNAQTICNLIADGFGVTMDFPLGENSSWAIKRAEIVELINVGNISANEIAASTGCSRRTVQRIKRRMIEFAKESGAKSA